MKYIKPKSLTWWASLVPLVAGVVVASEPLHGWASIVATINGITGDIEPAILINGALVAIGMRAAV